MKLEELKASISKMSDEELLKRLADIRKRRRSVTARINRGKREPSLNIDKLSKEEKMKLLEILKEDGNGS